VTLVTVPLPAGCQDAAVPFVVRTFGLCPAWLGSKSVRAAAAVVAPVPPFAIATVPVTFVALAELPAMLPEIAAPGIVAEAVIGLVPLPERKPVSVVAPVPPFATGTVPSEMAGVVVPVATEMGEVPVTLVTEPVEADSASWFQTAPTASKTSRDFTTVS